MHAQEHVALQALGFGQRIVVRRELGHVAGHDARLAQAARSVAASVVELEPRLEPGLQQRVATLDEELVPAWPDADVRGHHLEHVIHDRDRVGRVRGQHVGQPVLEEGAEFAQRRFRPVAGIRLGVDAVPQPDHECVIARKMPARVGEFLALREQPLREDLAAGQRGVRTRGARRLPPSGAPRARTRRSPRGSSAGTAPAARPSIPCRRSPAAGRRGSRAATRRATRRSTARPEKGSAIASSASSRATGRARTRFRRGSRPRDWRLPW